MANEHLLWFSVFIFYIAYRAFRNKSPNHEVGTVVAVVLGVLVFVVCACLPSHQPPTTFWAAVCSAAIGYSTAAALCSLATSRAAWNCLRNRLRPQPQEQAMPAPEQLSRIQMELETQLTSIEQSPFDEQTIDDLKEAARQTAVERMARILEQVDLPGEG